MHNMGAVRTNILQSGSHVPPATRKSLKKALAGRRRKGSSTSAPQRETCISGRLSPIEEEPDFVEEIVQKKRPRSDKSRLTHRTQPEVVVETIRMLSDPQKAEITRLGWGIFLRFKLGALESRDLYCWLMGLIDHHTMELKLPSGWVFPITEREVNLVLGVPLGGVNTPIHTSAEVRAAKTRLKDMLQISDRNITVDRLQAEIKKHRVDALSMQCFFLIIFNKLLFPTTSCDISSKEIALTLDLDMFSQINWARAVVEDLRVAVRSWQSRPATANPSINGCAPFVVVYYLDNLHHILNSTDRMSTPRCNLFSRTKIEHLTLADRDSSRGERSCYGLLPVKNTVGSCYHAPMNRNAALGPSPDPRRPHPSMEVPLIRDLLDDVMDQLPLRKRKQIALVVDKMDTAVQEQIAVISSAHQRVVDSVYRGAADIRKILLAESVHSGDVNRIGVSDDHQGSDDAEQADPTAVPGINDDTRHSSDRDTLEGTNPSHSPPPNVNLPAVVEGHQDDSHLLDTTAVPAANDDPLQPRHGNTPEGSNPYLVRSPLRTPTSASVRASRLGFDFDFWPPGCGFDDLDSTPATGGHDQSTDGCGQQRSSGDGTTPQQCPMPSDGSLCNNTSACLNHVPGHQGLDKPDTVLRAVIDDLSHDSNLDDSIAGSSPTRSEESVDMGYYQATYSPGARCILYSARSSIRVFWPSPGTRRS